MKVNLATGVLSATVNAAFQKAVGNRIYYEDVAFCTWYSPATGLCGLFLVVFEEDRYCLCILNIKEA